MGTAFPLADPSISVQLPGSRVTGEVALIAFYLSGFGCQLNRSAQHPSALIRQCFRGRTICLAALGQNLARAAFQPV